MHYLLREDNNVFLIEVHSANYAVCNCLYFARHGACKHCGPAIEEWKKTKQRTEWKEFDAKESAVPVSN